MAKRDWQILADETGRLDRQQVLDMLADVEAVGTLLGGVFLLAPIRRQVGDNLYVTVGWQCRWDSTAPAVQPERPDVEEVFEQQEEEEEVLLDAEEDESGEA